MSKQGMAVWFTGIPGSGKSAVARGVADRLSAQGLDVALLSMDERRKVYFPKPTYSPEEREAAYRMFVDEARGMTDAGKLVLMDATAHKLAMRQAARQVMPRFAEIYVRCSVETAMGREAARPGGQVMADLYAKALERKATGRPFEGLGAVPAVDVPFEEDLNAELILDNETVTLKQARDQALAFLESWLEQED